MESKIFPCSIAEIYSSDMPFVQEFTEPSMVEPCFNPSIMDIIMNPALAVVHEGVYDENGHTDEFEDIDDSWNNDLQNHPTLSQRDNAGHERSEDIKPDEVGKSSGTDETERSEVEEGKEEPGTEGTA